jgi:hypothetical protein
MNPPRLTSLRHLIPAISASAALFLPFHLAGAATVDLGSAASFAILAGTGITTTGPTTVNGDIGSFPNPTMTGFVSISLTGSIHHADAVAQAAQLSLSSAYTDAATRTPLVSFGPVANLSGMTLLPGVYNGSSSLEFSGTLTLDAAGNPDAFWIFQAGSTLVTAPDSSIRLINGADPCSIFWQVGSSATLGTNSYFAGTIMALASITLNTGTTIDGRALALNGAVTMDNAFIVAPVCSTPEADGRLLLTSFAATIAIRRRFRKRPAASPSV